MMKSAIFAAAVLFAGVMAAPVPEDAVVPESTKVDTVALPDIALLEAKPAACTDALMRSGGASGSTYSCSGPGPHGHHITYDVTVPSHCTSSSKCGVILNIHGQTMNSRTMEEHTGVAALVLAGKKYIVIAPSDYNNRWEFATSGGHDDAALIHDFLTKALEVYKDIVDTNRVHSTGFSAGAINSYRLLCVNSDKICSVAGIGFNPIGEMVNFHAPGSPVVRFPTCFNSLAGGAGPTHKRSMLFHESPYDPYFANNHGKDIFANTVNEVKAIYGMSGDGEKLSKGNGVDWTRYTAGDLTFEAASYKFVNPARLQGHCIPKKGEHSAPAYPASVMCGADAAGHAAGYTWGEEVIKFFEAHPCK